MTSTRTRTPLHDGWELRPSGAAEDAPSAVVDRGPVAATVPGCVHTDLLAAGLIEDPYVDRNEDDQHWIGRSAWEYRLTFEHEAGHPGARTDLVFDGLDTIAEVELNGEVLGTTANMHRTYRFDVGRTLRAGPNELVVRFAAPTNHAAALRDELGDLPNPYGEPYAFIRKMACNFGWDWGPRLTTSGIWRPVGLETWSGARAAAVRVATTVEDGELGVADVTVDVERASADAADDGIEVRAVLRSIDGAARPASTARVDGGTASLRLEVPDVARWWPIGRGDQPLYDLTVEVVADGEVTDVVRRRIGFRTVAIDESPTDQGDRWAITVNGERLWVRGLNWIPDDCFPSRVDRQRYAAGIDRAVGANANLLRIWGGGIYESDDLYELCDERGVLVWQDFLFACAAYPEEILRDEVRAEAADAVDRLASHPSLVLWNGNNECIEGWFDWGWQDEVGDRPWGAGIYGEVLPAVLAERDPTRPYLPGSPSAGDLVHPPNAQDRGPIHIWDVWNDLDYGEYRRYRPPFAAEFGFQAPPTHATLSEGVASRPLAIDDPNVAHHQKAIDGQQKLARALEAHFGPTDDVDDWLFLTQLNQARAIETGVGHLRSVHDRCSGTIWWQLNDCWPVISWAVVDGGGRPKPGWYALRRAYADRALVIDPTGDGPACVLVNDRRQSWRGVLSVRRVDAKGNVLAEEEVDVAVAPDDATRVVPGSHLVEPTDPTGELLIADIDGIRTCWAPAPDRDRRASASWTTRVEHRDGRLHVDVGAETLVRDLCLLADRLHPDATADSQLVTLLPGEHHRFVVTGVPDDHVDDAMARLRAGRPVLRAANDLQR
ncbi:MAG: glycoside hydrolase family 2 protein [Actinomycetota bacterium]|nr:glycoside hydrolase family 2 protein [Actinomycetota bacterium]